MSIERTYEAGWRVGTYEDYKQRLLKMKPNVLSARQEDRPFQRQVEGAEPRSGPLDRRRHLRDEAVL